MTSRAARKIILDLTEAAGDVVLVECQDGGENVDIVLSRVAGHASEVMSLREAERRLDGAIKRAYRALKPGFDIVGDPVAFINDR